MRRVFFGFAQDEDEDEAAKGVLDLSSVFTAALIHTAAGQRKNEERNLPTFSFHCF